MYNKVSDFFKEVSKNEKLRKELSRAEKGLGKNLGKEEVKDFFQQKFLPIAKKYGFNFTYEELREYRKSLDSKEAREQPYNMLEQVNGGVTFFCLIIGTYWE